MTGPLSPLEEGVWLATQLADRDSYNTGALFRVDGPLDTDRLRACLAELSRRHEALRFRYPVRDGVPERNLLPTLEIPLSVEAAASVPEATARAGKAAAEGFDLSDGPLWRARWYDCGAREGVLLLVFHHLVVDGWSLAILLADLADAYAGRVVRHEPGVRYVEHAARQRDRLAGAAGQRLAEFWTGALADMPDFALRTDFARPAVRTGRGAVFRFAMGSAVAERATGLARQERATLFAVLFAAFHVLLSRVCRQWDVPVGVPVANRTPDVERTVGLFVNSVVLRVCGEPSSSFRELVGACRDAAMDALEHQELPFSWVVNRVAPVRDPGRNPLFQVMFSVDDTGGRPPDWGDGPRVSALPFPIGAAKFDFDVTVRRGQDGSLHGELIYSTDLFEAATAAAYTQAFTSLVDRLTANPDRPLADVAIGETAGPVAGPVGTVPVHRLVWDQAARTPHAPAIVAGEEVVSYAELVARAEELAATLRRTGAGAEDVVALCLPRGADFVIGALAAMRAGAAYLPVDPAQPEAARRRVLDAARPVAVVDKTMTKVAAKPALPPGPDHPHQAAYVIHTSGSTGTPKAVVVGHTTLSRFVADRVSRYRIGPADRTMFVHSVAFDVHVEEIYPALAAGAAVVVEPFESIVSPESLVGTVVRMRVTILELPTALFHLLARQWPPVLRLPESVRVVIVGGERLDEALAHEWQRRAGAEHRLHNSYGVTEATSESTVAVVRGGMRDGVGLPLRHVRCEVVDALWQPLPPMLPGELVIGGPCLARGYLDDPAGTAARFVPDPRTSGQRLYLTGDLARLTPAGQVELLGRDDRQIKRDGFRLDLGEVEAVLRRDPTVSDVLAAWQAGGPGGGRLRCFVVAGAGAEDEVVAGVHRTARRELPGYAHPDTVEVLTRLPVNAHGKVDVTTLLRRPVPGTPAGTSATAAPTAAVAGRRLDSIVRVWRELLLPDAHQDTDFYAAGGHSLLAVRIAASIGAGLGVNVRLVDVLRFPTPRRLAEQLSYRAPSTTTIRRLPRGGDRHQ